MPRDARTYITVHDGMPEHPKVEELSDGAFRLLVGLWCWCSRNETDGKVKSAVWAKRGTPRARAELVDGGLAEPTADGWYMHDYLEHQRSAAEIEALRAKRSDAGRKGGKAKANAKASAKQVPEQTAGKVEADTEVDKPSNSLTSTGSRNVPIGGPAQVIRVYVDTAHAAGIPTPEESQSRISRSARSLLAQGYELDDVIEAAKNAAVGGWTDLAQQLQRDAGRVAAATNGARTSTTNDRSRQALTLAEDLDRKAIG